MKDECKGRVVAEIVCLRSKLYAFRQEEEDGCDGENEFKKAKSVKSNIVQNTITFQHYIDCLFKHNLVFRDQISIRSYCHEVFSEKTDKLVLSYDDDKRYIMKESTDTLPWGHYKISAEMI